MRLRPGIFPTDSLPTHVGPIDYAVDAMSAKVRRRPTIRQHMASSFDVVVCGYPRSGNSFVAGVLSSVGGSLLRIGGRQHSPLVAYAARSTKTPVVIPVRTPVDTIGSWLVFRQADLDATIVRKYIQSYIDWYRFVTRYRDPSNSQVVNFDIFTRQPNSIFRGSVVHELIGSVTGTVQPDEILSLLRQKELQERGATFATAASVPTASRERELAQAREALMKSPFHHLLEQAAVAYQELLASTVT